MARPQKYGLPTTGIKVPVELKDTIMFICFKYGELDEKSRIEYIEQLNEEIRKDFEKKICHFTGTCAFQTYSTVPYCNLQADCQYKK